MITIKRKDGDLMMSLNDDIYSITTDNGFIIIKLKNIPYNTKYIIPMTEIRIIEFD